MPTKTIQVAAVTTPNQWTLGAGADKVVAVNGPDDDDVSYIVSVGASYEQYSLASNSIPSGSTIGSVSVFSRCKKNTGSNSAWRVAVILGANSTESGTHAASSGSYTNATDVLLRPGGGTWAMNDLTTLQVYVRNLNTNNTRCTSLWLIVVYTPPANTGQMLEMFN